MDRLSTKTVIEAVFTCITYQYTTSSCKKVTKNMQSALQRPEVIREYLARQCAEGRVLSPLDQSQLSMVHTSRFGVIPKGSTGKWRLILDLSSPEGHSLNDGIQESLCSLWYVSVDDAVYAV